MAILGSVRPSYATNGIEELLLETHWGETSAELLHQFGDEARWLPHALDFGDSYTDVALTRPLGGVPMVVFFQMDKATRGLKRIQLERPRHGVNPPSFRAIAAALHTDYGRPDQTCVIPVLPASGYQAAAEERWVRSSRSGLAAGTGVHAPHLAFARSVGTGSGRAIRPFGDTRQTCPGPASQSRHSMALGQIKP